MSDRSSGGDTHGVDEMWVLKSFVVALLGGGLIGGVVDGGFMFHGDGVFILHTIEITVGSAIAFFVFVVGLGKLAGEDVWRWTMNYVER